MVTDRRLDFVAVPAGMQKSGQIHKTFKKEVVDLKWEDNWKRRRIMDNESQISFSNNGVEDVGIP